MTSGIKLTSEIINQRLADEGRDITIIGNYVTANTKTEYQCSLGHKWFARPAEIRRGNGCPRCSGCHKPTTEEFRQMLVEDNRGIILLDEYVNNSTKITFECVNHHRWRAVPLSITSGRGCPTCAQYGFSPSKPAWVYVIRFANYIKYGITNELNQRLRQHKKNGDYDLIYVHHYDDGHIAKNWETNIKQILGGRFATKEQCPDGYTETLCPTKLSVLLEIVTNR